MDRDPLPRASFQVADRVAEEVGPVLELTEAAVAVETEYAAHVPGRVVMVNMLRGRPHRRSRNAALPSEEAVELRLRDPIASLSGAGLSVLSK
jgi:hypothetical protein